MLRDNPSTEKSVAPAFRRWLESVAWVDHRITGETPVPREHEQLSQ